MECKTNILNMTFLASKIYSILNILKKDEQKMNKVIPKIHLLFVTAKNANIILKSQHLWKPQQGYKND